MTKKKLPNWQDVWLLIGREDQSQAIKFFLNAIRSDSDKNLFDNIINKLSRVLHFRKQSVIHMSDSQLTNLFMKNILSIFTHEHWCILFRSYYFKNKCEIMCRFLDLVEIEHDELGAITVDDFTLPENVEEVGNILIKEFGCESVFEYFSVLILINKDDFWPLEVIVENLYQNSGGLERVAEDQDLEGSSRHKPIALEYSEEFTQLDRVLIDQIISTVSGEDRSLTDAQLIDLLETVHSLDTQRKRTYFHIGFMDYLLIDREINFNRPEMNDERRSWYLAGVLSGIARLRDKAQLEKILKDNRKIFFYALKNRDGSSTAMLRTVYHLLLDENKLNESVELLRSEIGAIPLATIYLTLEKAESLLRNGEAGSADSLLRTIEEIINKQDLVDDDFVYLTQRVQRKRGQAMQAQGNLIAAKEIFEKLISSQNISNPDLLADMGMVIGGFRELSEIWIHDDDERMASTYEQLKSGELYFKKAAEEHGQEAINAQYILSIMYFIQSTNFDHNSSDEILYLILKHVNYAISGMTTSAASNAYDELGIIGRARFIQANALAKTLDRAKIKGAMNAWEKINYQAGDFPERDVKQFLEAISLVDLGYAVQVAESIWSYKGVGAINIIKDTNIIKNSLILIDELVKHARSDEQDKKKKWNYWTMVIPILLEKNNLEIATEGLDELENLAINREYTKKMINWLGDNKNYEPAWSEEDVLRAKFRLFRKLGDDSNAFSELRTLFFLIRDTDAEQAEQILSLFKDYKSPVEFYSDLTLPEFADEEISNIDNELEALKSGESLSILFIGGNEVQARYDENIINSIQKEWPGVTINFQHTGWSSNWGRDIQYFKKLARDSDAVVMMTMMRTMLGRKMRAIFNDPPRPWVPCTGTGKKSIKG